MDAYTSLLNLNFMSSWRTGNSLVDMIIAIFIPIISNWVATFFSSTWPDILRFLVHSLDSPLGEVKIQHGATDRYHRAVDLTEGGVLQEAVEQYADQCERPFYRMGEFKYNRLGTKDEGGSSKNISKILESGYKLTSRPSNQQVEITKGLSMRVQEGDDKNGDDENQNDQKRKQRHGGEADSKTLKQSKMRELVFAVKETRDRAGAKDPVLSFVSTAFEWYKKELSSATKSQRYLFHPTKTSGDGVGGFCTDNELVSLARYPLLGSKTFTSLFFPEKEKLITLIDQFEKKTGKFAVPEFPHRLTLLLHGPPGTGKTSLVKAIAQRTKRHIFSIPLSEVRTNRELISCMNDQNFALESSNRSSRITLRADKVIYLLEDADATSDIMLADKKKGLLKKASQESDLAADILNVKGILEAFGGILDAPKRIIVMTTNHIERLDPAIVRLGFVTMRLHMGNFAKDDAVRMVQHYYTDVDATPERMGRLSDLIDSLAKRGIEFSPSELEQLCAEYDTVEELIQVLSKGTTDNLF